MITRFVRRAARKIANVLNVASKGKLSPNAITLVGLLAHLPIAWLVAQQRFIIAAVLLVIFGLFDTIDGELARVQNKTSALGMFLDSVSDRAKEIILYLGIIWALVAMGHTYASIWALAALGCSLLTSYINAWGDAVALKGKIDRHEPNSSLRGGIMSYEMRMSWIVAALLFDQLVIALALITILSLYTTLERFTRMARRLT